MSSNNQCIIYCRQSKADSETPLSLDSQEYANKEYMKSQNMRLYKVVKDIGSAFSKPQTDLKNILRSCKNKTIVVFEASRLSRNVNNFKEIYKICVNNKHNIAIVNMDTIFDYRISSNYKILYDIITRTQQESIDLGQRISRSIKFKKSQQPKWCYEKNDEGIAVKNNEEIKITKLITLLGSKNSSIQEIRDLVEEVGITENVEPFEIVEYERGKGCVELEVEKMPYAMNLRNIEQTLNIYKIKRRGIKWNQHEINAVLKGKFPTTFEDELSESLTEMSINDGETEMTDTTSDTDVNDGWISIYYDPSVGLPPNIALPENITLPNKKTMIYLPKTVFK